MAKKKNLKDKKKKKSKGNFSFLLLLLILVTGCLLYLPAAILFIIGMLPTFVAYLTDSKVGKNKTFTIGALNFSACFYYLIDIWNQPVPMDAAMNYISDPMTIIIVYTTAGFGYVLNYISTVMISSVLRQKSLMRLDKLEEKKKKLEERWGEKVNGERALDKFGFIKINDDYEEES